MGQYCDRCQAYSQSALRLTTTKNFLWEDHKLLIRLHHSSCCRTVSDMPKPIPVMQSGDTDSVVQSVGTGKASAVYTCACYMTGPLQAKHTRKDWTRSRQHNNQYRWSLSQKRWQNLFSIHIHTRLRLLKVFAEAESTDRPCNLLQEGWVARGWKGGGAEEGEGVPNVQTG